jgi:hypothetical protein
MSSPLSCFADANKNSAWNGFWAAQPELNDPSLNSPQPCKWAEHCVYNGKGGCGYVHPGEQGTGRKLFEARLTKKGDAERWEKPAVRLIGRPQFYERRRLRLSWPQWCERQNLPAPVPLSASAPAKKAPTVPVAPPVAAPAPVPVAASPLASQPQAPQMMMHPAHMQQMMFNAWMAYYGQVPAVPAVPAVPLAPAVQPPRYRRDVVGNKLYSIIAEQLSASIQERTDAGLVHPKITPGKITAMILENGLDHAEELMADLSTLGDVVIEACEVILKAFPSA